jgi:hypothetical protein
MGTDESQSAEPRAYRSILLWIGTIFSGLTALSAFGISVATFYLTTLKTVDEVQVVISSSPTVSQIGKAFDAPKFQLDDSQQLTFVNAGTQEAAVVSVNLLVVDVHDDIASCDNIYERTMGSKSYPYIMSAVVVKPREIAAINVKLKNGKNTFEPMFSASQSDMNYNNDAWKILTCLEFNVVVPGSQQLVRKFAGDNSFNKDGTGSQAPVFNQLETLVKHVSTVFSK